MFYRQGNLEEPPTEAGQKRSPGSLPKARPRRDFQGSLYLDSGACGNQKSLCETSPSSRDIRSRFRAAAVLSPTQPVAKQPVRHCQPPRLSVKARRLLKQAAAADVVAVVRVPTAILGTQLRAEAPHKSCRRAHEVCMAQLRPAPPPGATATKRGAAEPQRRGAFGYQ